MPERTSLKEDIARTRAALDEEYYQLGKNIFESTDKTNIKINTLLDSLIRYRIELHGRKRLMVCGRCGMENELGHSFCSHCGQKISGENEFLKETPEKKNL